MTVTRICNIDSTIISATPRVLTVTWTLDIQFPPKTIMPYDLEGAPWVVLNGYSWPERDDFRRHLRVTFPNAYMNGKHIIFKTEADRTMFLLKYS